MRGAIALGVAAAPIAPCVRLFPDPPLQTPSDRDPGVCAPDSGSDAADGATTIDFCAWSSLEARGRATRTCALLGACEAPLGESAFGPCMLHALAAFDCTFNPWLRPRGPSASLW